MGSFKKATRKTAKLRLAIDGPAGAGKTMTALRFAFALGKRVAVIDTERGSASKYEGENLDGEPFAFDVLQLVSFSPSEYTQAIEAAGREGYDVLIIDSLSHAWEGVGGALELVDKKSTGGNSYTAWKDVTPLHRRMIDAILNAPLHVIATMRSKVEYVLEEQENRQGRKVQVPRRIGMAPVQRAGMEYEFDIYGSMEQQTHTLTISKSRCRAVADAVVTQPGAAWLAPVVAWLNGGEAAQPQQVPTPTPEVIEAVAGAETADEAPRCTEEQVSKIETLRVRLGYTPEQIGNSLWKKYGTRAVASLDQWQADAAIATLTQLADMKEQSEARLAALPRTGSK